MQYFFFLQVKIVSGIQTKIPTNIIRKQIDNVGTANRPNPGALSFAHGSLIIINVEAIITGLVPSSRKVIMPPMTRPIALDLFKAFKIILTILQL